MDGCHNDGSSLISLFQSIKSLICFTHFIKLSLTVHFIPVNKCEHDPVTDNSTLEGKKSNEKSEQLVMLQTDFYWVVLKTV